MQYDDVCIQFWHCSIFSELHNECFMKGKLKAFFSNSYKAFKYAYIIIKVTYEEATNNAFLNNLMHLKSKYLETESTDNCKIITTSLVSKFLTFTHMKGCSLPESSMEVSGKRKSS